MSNNLATYFNKQAGRSSTTSGASPGDDDDMGPSVSMAVEAEDDDHFNRSTFNLKRTRSMGLLDDYVGSSKKDEGSEADSEEAAEESDFEDDDNVNENAGSSALRSATPGLSESASPPVPETDNYLIPHDDNDLVHEPKRHVDYLSHQWDEGEISQSWKYIILKKKKKDEDLVNAARLENASWRTWAKARNHLQTVSPEVVNWSKDSDVTWLYGPVVRQKTDPGASSDQEFGYGSDDETSKRVRTSKNKKRGPKPILKKRSVSEILEENSLWRLNVARQHKKILSSTQDMVDGYGDTMYAPEDYDALAAKVNAQYYSSNPSAYSQGNASEPLHEDPGVESSVGPPSERPQSQASTLESIMTSTSKKTPKGATEQKDRHIHFNDRVEQCMAVAFHSDDDNDFDDSTDDSDGERSAHHEYPLTRNRTRGVSDDSDYIRESYSDEDMNSSSSDEDEAGLFINARYSRKTDGSRSPSTRSSIGSESALSKENLTPIIKLLPATTLNYGSDEEEFDDDDEYYGNNAVSHNVNTFRGYDYMYDYNSVYTGDTSSFMAVNSCDMVDVPEGLQTPIEGQGDHADMLANPNSSPQLPSDAGKGGFSLDSDTDSYGSDGDAQFIEDSQNKDSDDELSSMPGLRRVPSHGKSSTTSIQDLRLQPAAIPTTHSFITGKPLRQTEQPWDTVKSKPVPKTRSFVLDSDSDSDTSDKSESGSENSDINKTSLQAGDTSAANSSGADSKPAYSVPTHATIVSPVPKGQRITSSSPVNIACSGDSGTSLSDVAIAGYISPRSDSMQSVVAKENMVSNKSSNSEVDRMNKNLENWHIDPQKDDADDASSENVQKMMSSAREIASKYLHSWKK